MLQMEVTFNNLLLQKKHPVLSIIKAPNKTF